jgi:hypothetical protein
MGTKLRIPVWCSGFELNHLDLNKDQWRPYVTTFGSRLGVGVFELNHVLGKEK